MTQNRLLILLLILVSLVILPGCEAGSTKSKIANTMREYIEAGLTDEETFGFVGLSNHRDTVFMGVTHPCVGVIYTITNKESGEKIRYFADVIFSDDYKTALCVKESDFDPIEFVEEKIKEKFMEKIQEKLKK
ncbi:MAG: hypothetical protein K2H47_04460 [Muribaculaceae bacterium]|nr:hypothetical protein [Muribaculaceae bacterium]